jgi:hypothetical protein
MRLRHSLCGGKSELALKRIQSDEGEIPFNVYFSNHFSKAKNMFLEKPLEPVFSGFADRADFRGVFTGTEISTDRTSPDGE